MIFGNIQNLQEYSFLEKGAKICLDYAKSHELVNDVPGSYKIDGDRLFVNIVEYETTVPEQRFWEAHRKYLDLHLMLRGTEQIDLNFISNMVQKPYVETEDFLPMDGEKNSSVILREGDFLICYPNDGHRTAVAARQPEKIKKAIFKVQVPSGM